MGLRGVLVDCKRANYTAIFKKNKKRDLGSYRLVSFTSLWEGDGENPPGLHFPIDEGQEGDQK